MLAAYASFDQYGHHVNTLSPTINRRGRVNSRDGFGVDSDYWGVSAGAGVVPASSGSLGFVPTMGYLHEGHVALVRRARAENDGVAASIFVNPAQFAPDEDFSAYPRDLERDLAMLDAAGCDLVFHPSPEEMYPPPEQDVYVVRRGILPTGLRGR